MNLQKIQTYIGLFKNYLKQTKATKQLYKWESLQTFQVNWDIAHPNLATIYDKSLKNSQTMRLWKQDNYTPKRMMVLFAQVAPDYVRHCFKDLFNEDKDITGRIDRFLFYCEEMLVDYKQQNVLSIENNHYHDNYIISLYLTFRHPEQYTLYDFTVFQQAMKHLGSRNIPELNDIERFFKVSRTLWKFLEKDEEVWKLHQQRLYSPIFYKEKSLLLVHEFLQVVANKAIE